jgi:hypothetical protein
MTLLETKQAIWNHKKVHRNPVDLQVWADKISLPLQKSFPGSREPVNEFNGL